MLGCVPRPGTGGGQECASTERQIQSGQPVVPVVKPGRRRLCGRARATTHAADYAAPARTSWSPGDHVYPETGNGGYISLHTDVDMVYDAPTNTFLPGNHVELTDQATQCLTDFSLDFETQGPARLLRRPEHDDQQGDGGRQPATDLQAPTYPGDPNGRMTPTPTPTSPRSSTPSGGPTAYAPACSPELRSSELLYGTPCPANKLVITPRRRSPTARRSRSRRLHGTPGVHRTETAPTRAGSAPTTRRGRQLRTTEPVGTEDWMPLNDHPSAKPTYDFYDTVNAGRPRSPTVIWCRDQQSARRELRRRLDDWHWHSPETIANYLVEDSVAGYDLSERLSTTGPNAGVAYYEAQGNSITPPRRRPTRRSWISSSQSAISRPVQRPYPATTDGVIVGIPSASFEEEMQTKITFNGGTISLSTFHHENMHQWWGDHVSESNYNMTFFKEGMAQLSQYWLTAAARGRGRHQQPPGSAAFDNSLISRSTLTKRPAATLDGAPSNPTPLSCSQPRTPTPTGDAYIALYQIIGLDQFRQGPPAPRRTTASEHHRAAVGGRVGARMPNQSAACQAKLATFFTQWFDTAYPSGGGANKPQLTGPGLAGPGSTTHRVVQHGDPARHERDLLAGRQRRRLRQPDHHAGSVPEQARRRSDVLHLDNGGWTPYTALPGDEPGQHTLQFYSTDSQGNQELTNSTTFFVDQSPPVTSGPSGTVASTCSCRWRRLAELRHVQPGVGATYTTSVAAVVTTTAAQSTLIDRRRELHPTGPSGQRHYLLPSPLQAGRDRRLIPDGEFRFVGRTTNPLTLLNIRRRPPTTR